MAITTLPPRVNDKDVYVGLHADTKPTLDTQHNGSQFYEYDTGDWFIWLGAAWQNFNAPAAGGGGGATVVLGAGSAIAGKVGIDQTTPGTTNGVQINAALPAGSAYVGHVGGQAARVRGTVNSVSPLTRPADTTAYTAKDTVADSTSSPHVWQFANMARVVGGSGRIVKALLGTSQTTNTETFRLHLYNAAPTAIDDNVACSAPLGADFPTKYVGTIEFPACKVEGTGADTAYAVNAYDVLEFICAADANLYGILETPNGFTPASAQTFEIVLLSDQD